MIMTTNPILTPDLLKLINSGDIIQPREVVEDVHPAEMADFIGAFARVMLLGNNSTLPVGVSLAWVGTAISIALGLQVVSSTLIGALLPLIATKLKLDPALVASPALTTIVDITGLLLFFGTAKLLLPV